MNSLGYLAGEKKTKVVFQKASGNCTRQKQAGREELPSECCNETDWHQRYRKWSRRGGSQDIFNLPQRRPQHTPQMGQWVILAEVFFVAMITGYSVIASIF